MHIRARVRFDANRVKKKVDQASFKSLSHAGGTIRKTAYRSIRKRKNPSRPGSPPSSPTGRLRRSFRYEVDRRTPGVVIGPVNEIAGRLQRAPRDDKKITVSWGNADQNLHIRLNICVLALVPDPNGTAEP